MMQQKTEIGLQILELNAEKVKWKITGLDEDYTREDREIKFELWNYNKETESSEATTSETKPIFSITKDNIKPRIKNSEVYEDTFSEKIDITGSYYGIAKMYYSYTDFLSYRQDFNLPEVNIYTNYQLKQISENFPNSKLWDKELSNIINDNGEVKEGLDITELNKFSKFKQSGESAVKFYEEYKNSNNKSYIDLAKKLVDRGYFAQYNQCPLFSYYPYITATELINYKGDWDKWVEEVYIKRIQKNPLIKTAKRRITVKDGENISAGSGITIGAISAEAQPSVKYDENWLKPEYNTTIVSSGSTQYKALFPPILESSQPSFVGKLTSEYRVYFRLSDYVNYANVAHVDFRITLQSNNSSVVNSKQWPDQIIYKVKERKDGLGDITDHGNGLYSVLIKSDILNTGDNFDIIAGHWEDNTYYKIQARLGTTWSGWNNSEEYVKWRNEQASQGNFSEWSTIMILKSIAQPSVKILNNQTLRDSLSAEETMVEISTSPLFYGQYKQSNINSSEFLETYQFILYDENDKILEDSGILQYNNVAEQNNEVVIPYRFKRDLAEFNKKDNEYNKYSVKFIVNTVNGYVNSDTYKFEVSDDALESDDFNSEEYKLMAVSEEEDGIIKLILQNISKSSLPSGNFVITRNKEGTDLWEDLNILQLFNEKVKEKMIFIDYTPESGVKYSYGIQKINSKEQRTQRIIVENCSVDFEHIFLYDGNRQLKLKYNPSISSFKHTVLASKQDTLGGKFPYINRNGFVYYAEFPIEALISFNMDENGHFVSKASLNPEEDLICVREKGIINSYKEKNEDKEKRHQRLLPQQSSSTNLTYENIYNEKSFRDEVEKFLNNGEYKLFRSSTEGNLIISLMNVSFSPKKELGRMISNVTAQAYEMADYSIDNLKKYNLLKTGTYTSVLGNQVVCGQLQGVFTEQDNLFLKAKEQVAATYFEKNHDIILKKLDRVELIPFPRINLAERLKLAYTKDYQNFDINNALVFNKSYEELEQLSEALKEYSSYTPINLNINRKTFITLPDTPYVLEDQNFSISDNMYIEKLREETNLEPAYYPPILFNYWGVAEKTETQRGLLESSYRKRGYNQLYGYFLEENKSPYFILNNENSEQIKTSDIGINYYNGMDIKKIILEQIRVWLQEKEGLDLTESFWYKNEGKDEIKIPKTSTVINLTDLRNIVVITQDGQKVEVDNKEYECGTQGRTFETFKSSIAFPKDNKKMIFATVFYDYSLIFKNYLELEKENKEQEEEKING